MRRPQVSKLTTARLSLYLRCLRGLEKERIERISSAAMAKRLGLNSAQIRRDLASFGEFGVRGVGYRVAELRDNLIRILGLHRTHNLIIVGAGNLGMALAGYRGFRTGGFRVTALFDSSADRVRELASAGLPSFHMRELKRVVRRTGARIAVLAVPAPAGQQALDAVYAAGIRAILNFVPVQLEIPTDCEFARVDLKVQLESLAHHLAGIPSRLSKGLPPARPAQRAGASGRRRRR